MMLKRIVLVFFLLYTTVLCTAQDDQRFATLESELKHMSKTQPGLLNQVEISVSAASIAEFVRALAATSNTNISVDENINVQITNNFSNAKLFEILLYLCRTYDLDLDIIGSIIRITKFQAPTLVIQKPKPKLPEVSYTSIGQILSFNLEKDSLFKVAREITKYSRKNVILTEEIRSKVVSGFISKMPFENALEKLALTNNLSFSKTEDDFYLFGAIDKTNSLTASNKRKSNSARTGKGISVGDDQLNFSINTQGYIDISATDAPIASVISLLSYETEKDYFLFSSPGGKVSFNMQKATYDQVLDYVLNGTEFTFKKQEEVYLIGNRNLEKLRSTELFTFKYRTVDKIIDVIPAELSKGVNVKMFSDLNSLVLSGSRPSIEELKIFLRQLDVVVPVVVIDVLIVDVRNTKTLSTGIQAGITNDEVPETSGTVFPGLDVGLNSGSINKLIEGINGLGLINLGQVNTKFYLNLKLLEQQGYLKVRSTPRLATLNGHEASLSIGSREYYLEESNNVIGSQNPQNIITQTYKPVNADLAVRINPIVSGDEHITLDISVNQSNFTERISQNAPPGSITRDFQSLIRVKNGEMVLLGGLEEDTKNDSGSGVPFLSRIPVIKWLFSSRTRSRGKNKLTIFIRPTVIY